MNVCSRNVIFPQAQNIDEARKDYYRGVAMPFQMNNVDVTVAANAIYGITASVLSGVLPASVLDDPIVRVCYSKRVLILR